MAHDADELHALNNQLLAVRQLMPGVDLGFSPRHETMALQLESINRTCYREEAEHRPLQLRSILATSAGAVPPEYSRLIETGEHCPRLAEPLERLTELAGGLEGVRNQVVVALIYPLLLCLLAGFVLAFISQVTISELEATYVALDAPIGAGTVFMERVRSSLPMWLVGGIIVLGALWYLVARASGPWRSRATSISMTSPIELDLLASESVELGATLTEQGIPAADAIRQAQETLVPARFKTDRLPDVVSRPFLKWTLDQAGTGSDPELLRTAAALYGQMATRQGEWVGRVLPLLLTVLLGGLATLLVGLSLFVPFSQFMQAIASLVETV